ncbi:MAG TPA: GntR family transcriptional regulator [Pirellulales bacterium]|nr:GntR family transcriptional regulator [Pirellulales bacterium]
METVKRQNLSEVIVGQIKDFIISNDLKPGDRLPTEHQMAARFGVSRVSVREATKALGFLGVLRAAPRRGLTVGEFDVQRVTEQLAFPLVLTNHPKSQLLATRIVIETGALPHVAANMAEDSTIYDRLVALNDLSVQGTTLDERIASDIAFHKALLSASNLGPLVAFNDLLQVFFDRFRSDLAPRDPEGKTAGHAQIIEALRHGDVQRACDELRVHLDYYEAYL